MYCQDSSRSMKEVPETDWTTEASLLSKRRPISIIEPVTPDKSETRILMERIVGDFLRPYEVSPNSPDNAVQSLSDNRRREGTSTGREKPMDHESCSISMPERLEILQSAQHNRRTGQSERIHNDIDHMPSQIPHIHSNIHMSSSGNETDMYSDRSDHHFQDAGARGQQYSISRREPFGFEREGFSEVQELADGEIKHALSEALSGDPSPWEPPNIKENTSSFVHQEENSQTPSIAAAGSVENLRRSDCFVAEPDSRRLGASLTTRQSFACNTKQAETSLHDQDGPGFQSWSSRNPTVRQRKEYCPPGSSFMRPNSESRQEGRNVRSRMEPFLPDRDRKPSAQPVSPYQTIFRVKPQPLEQSPERFPSISPPTLRAHHSAPVGRPPPSTFRRARTVEESQRDHIQSVHSWPMPPHLLKRSSRSWEPTSWDELSTAGAEGDARTLPIPPKPIHLPNGLRRSLQNKEFAFPEPQVVAIPTGKDGALQRYMIAYAVVPFSEALKLGYEPTLKGQTREVLGGGSLRDDSLNEARFNKRLSIERPIRSMQSGPLHDRKPRAEPLGDRPMHVELRHTGPFNGGHLDNGPLSDPLPHAAPHSGLPLTGVPIADRPLHGGLPNDGHVCRGLVTDIPANGRPLTDRARPVHGESMTDMHLSERPINDRPLKLYHPKSYHFPHQRPLHAGYSKESPRDDGPHMSAVAPEVQGMERPSRGSFSSSDGTPTSPREDGHIEKSAWSSVPPPAACCLEHKTEKKEDADSTTLRSTSDKSDQTGCVQVDKHPASSSNISDHISQEMLVMGVGPATSPKRRRKKAGAGEQKDEN